MFLMASRGEGGVRWLMVETRGNGKAEGGGGTGYGGRRKEEGGRRTRVTAESGRRSELRMCSYLAGLHLWTTEEFVRREEGGRSSLLRGCAFVWLLCFGW